MNTTLSKALPDLAPEIGQLKLSEIRLDSNTQSRAKLEESIIGEYKELYQTGVDMPPLEVVFDGVHYWLVHGFHRRWGADRAGLESLPCRVTNGTREDAQWASYQQNQSHGLRRSNADKENAIKRALRHPKGIEMSDSQLAQVLGVTDKTVTKYRSELESTSEIPKLETTTGKDGKARKRRRENPPAPAPDPAAEPVDDDPQVIERVATELDDQPQDDVVADVEGQQPRSRGRGVQRAHEAIACLKRIPVNDALRSRAFEIVRDWMDHNK